MRTPSIFSLVAIVLVSFLGPGPLIPPLRAEDSSGLRAEAAPSSATGVLTSPSDEALEGVATEVPTRVPATATSPAPSAPPQRPTPTATPGPVANHPCLGSSGLDFSDLKNGDILLAAAPVTTSDHVLLMGFGGTYWHHSALYFVETGHSCADARVIEAVGPVGISVNRAEDEVHDVPIQESVFFTNDVFTDWVVLRVQSGRLGQDKVDAATQYALRKARDDAGVRYLPPGPTDRAAIAAAWLQPGNKAQEAQFYSSLLVWRAYMSQGLDLDAKTSVWGTDPTTGRLTLADKPVAHPTSQVRPDDLFLTAVTLEARRRMTVVKDKHGGSVRAARTLIAVEGPADLRVVDANGNSAGIDPERRAAVRTIPNSYVSAQAFPADVEPEWVSIDDFAGTLRVEVRGTGTGSYTLLVQVFYGQGYDTTEFSARMTQPDQVDVWTVSDPRLDLHSIRRVESSPAQLPRSAPAQVPRAVVPADVGRDESVLLETVDPVQEQALGVE